MVYPQDENLITIASDILNFSTQLAEVINNISLYWNVLHQTLNTCRHWLWIFVICLILDHYKTRRKKELDKIIQPNETGAAHEFDQWNASKDPINANNISV